YGGWESAGHDSLLRGGQSAAHGNACHHRRPEGIRFFLHGYHQSDESQRRAYAPPGDPNRRSRSLHGTMDVAREWQGSDPYDSFHAKEVVAISGCPCPPLLKFEGLSF